MRTCCVNDIELQHGIQRRRFGSEVRVLIRYGVLGLSLSDGVLEVQRSAAEQRYALKNALSESPTGEIYESMADRRYLSCRARSAQSPIPTSSKKFSTFLLKASISATYGLERVAKWTF
jgi:hypothetical protein